MLDGRKAQAEQNNMEGAEALTAAVCCPDVSAAAPDRKGCPFDAR